MPYHPQAPASRIRSLATPATKSPPVVGVSGRPYEKAKAVRRAAKAEPDKSWRLGLGLSLEADRNWIAGREGLIECFVEKLIQMVLFNLSIVMCTWKLFPGRHCSPLVYARGDASAQDNLGFMYDNGQGAPQDYAEDLVPPETVFGG